MKRPTEASTEYEWLIHFVKMLDVVELRKHNNNSRSTNRPANWAGEIHNAESLIWWQTRHRPWHALTKRLLSRFYSITFLRLAPKIEKQMTDSVSRKQIKMQDVRKERFLIWTRWNVCICDKFCLRQSYEHGVKVRYILTDGCTFSD